MAINKIKAIQDWIRVFRETADIAGPICNFN